MRLTSRFFSIGESVKETVVLLVPFAKGICTIRFPFISEVSVLLLSRRDSRLTIVASPPDFVSGFLAFPEERNKAEFPETS